MMHPDDPLRFYRTSREAYGTSLYFPKRSKDWMWFAGTAFALAALFLLGYYTA